MDSIKNYVNDICVERAANCVYFQLIYYTVKEIDHFIIYYNIIQCHSIFFILLIFQYATNPVLERGVFK